jgi:hypothetical protein
MTRPWAVRIAVQRESFTDKERETVQFGGLRASAFRFDAGIEAIRLSNARGHVVVLPYVGELVWNAIFDDVGLAMHSMFSGPRPAKRSWRPMGASLTTPGSSATASRVPATRILHMAKRRARIWTKRASPAAWMRAAPGSR